MAVYFKPNNREGIEKPALVCFFCEAQFHMIKGIVTIARLASDKRDRKEGTMPGGQNERIEGNMTAVAQVISRHKYKILLGALLVAASLISVALELVQARFNERSGYRFLVWNLFLAWIPFVAAVVAWIASRKRLTFFIVMPVCTVVWLIFFPNAPYLLTDFQHLAYPGGQGPLWYDVLEMVWFASTGLLLGIASLYLMQEIITRTFTRLIGWVFAVGVTILSSIGVYLGRFSRFNSWDLLQDPLPVAKDMAGLVRDPFANLPSYVFLILFTLLFLFIYVAVHLFGSATREHQ